MGLFTYKPWLCYPPLVDHLHSNWCDNHSEITGISNYVHVFSGYLCWCTWIIIYTYLSHLDHDKYFSSFVMMRWGYKKYCHILCLWSCTSKRYWFIQLKEKQNIYQCKIFERWMKKFCQVTCGDMRSMKLRFIMRALIILCLMFFFDLHCCRK